MDQPLLAVLIFVPVAMGALSSVLRDRRLLAAVDVLGSATLLGMCLAVVMGVGISGPVRYGFLYVDQLSALFLLIIGVLALAASLYSVKWLEQAVLSGQIPANHLWLYYVLLDAFLWSMLLAATSNNLGVLWIAMEASTIASALLVGFLGRRDSLEAAWKYLIVNTIGIAFALFGTVLFYAAAAHAGVPEESAFDWTALRDVASKFDPDMVRVAFVFIFIGYGTKAGLVPMHAWLPDTYSAAPVPVSALLSGALVKCAILTLLRFQVLALQSVGAQFTQQLFLVFGIMSLVVAAAMILLQRDARRLLGYSSVEHIGIISTGIGFGGMLGLYASLLHIINHSTTKALCFFGVGDAVTRVRTNEMRRIRGLLEATPWSAALMLVGVFSLAGTPPFSIFVGELLVLRAGIAGGHLVACVLFLLPVAVVFGGLLYHLVAMAFGRPHGRLRIPSAQRESAWSLAGMVVVALPVIVLGLSVPEPLHNFLTAAASIATGGGTP